MVLKNVSVNVRRETEMMCLRLLRNSISITELANQRVLTSLFKHDTILKAALITISMLAMDHMITCM